MIDSIMKLAEKWNSKRLVAAGAAGYGVYALTAAASITGPLGAGIMAGLALAYIWAETVRPSVDEKPKGEGNAPKEQSGQTGQG